MFSLRNRLFRTESFRHAALYAGLCAGSMAVLIVVVYVILDSSFKTDLQRQIDDDLTAIRTAYATAKPAKKLHEAKEMIDDRLLAPDADDVFLLQRGNERIAGNLPPMPVRLGVFSMGMPQPKQAKAGEHLILGRGEMLGPQIYAYVGRDLHQVKAAEDRLLMAFGVVLLANVILALASGLFLSRTFLRRVDAIAETCGGIMAGRLSERIPAAGKNSEFERLGLTINSMLDRIQTLMDSLRQVSTDIAHDLRTPLTHLRHKLESVRSETASPQDYAAAVDSAVAECDKLLDIFTALLRIAQIEAGARRAAFRDVDLKTLVEDARDMHGPGLDDSKHILRVEAEPVPLLRGDAQLLMQLISNLLDNALAHTPTGTEITLFCGVIDGVTKLVVSDNGPGISENDRKNVLRRFYRCEQSRTTEGSGLGLSLVAAVAELHDATLTLAANTPGLRVEVSFPSHPA